MSPERVAPSGIIEKTPGLSDHDMINQIELMIKVFQQTKEIKVGRGRSVSMLKIPKYPESKQFLDLYERSIQYYKEQMTTRKKIQLRDYQEEISKNACDIILEHGFVYLAMEVRTGKTLTSLSTAKRMGCKHVVFVTKKKAISSIEADYELLDPGYHLEVLNYESLHKLNIGRCDMLILDEAHTLGAFPKPSMRAKQIKQVIERYGCYVCLLSGTPTPESYAQIYHQVYGINGNPFSHFANFYRFADQYVRVKSKKMNGLYIKDYSDGIDRIIEDMAPYTISYSQKDAGFITSTIETVIEVEMPIKVRKLIDKLKKDLVIEGQSEVILADTATKLMSKVHQLCSGTVKFESGNSMVIDPFKADFIRDRFSGQKIGIFYKFKEELNALMASFGKDNLCVDLDEFNSTDKNIALQIVSGREGISLKQASALVYFNIDFSATSYWQSRDRMTTKDREKNQIYWIFSKGGIEAEVYKAVMKKTDYTKKHFERDIGRIANE